MKVDLERLRESVRHVRAEGWPAVQQPELAALVAVVDAAREYVRGPERAERIADGFERLVHTLGPFAEAPSERRWLDAIKARRASGRAWVDRYPLPGDDPSPPPADRAWEDVDRWNAEHLGSCRCGGATCAIDNPRDRVRDRLADAGVAVQQQFRSDQERIFELERERDEWADRARGAEHNEGMTMSDVRSCEERICELELELADALADTVEHGRCADTISRLARERQEAEQERDAERAVADAAQEYVRRRTMAAADALIKAVRAKP